MSTQQPSSILQDFTDSLFMPGVKPGVVRVMNVSFIALFVSLVFLAFLTKANIYVIMLFVINVGLFLAINAFVKYMESDSALTGDVSQDVIEKTREEMKKDK
ncbi:uncharacterized protein VTP21DRAFT_7091 [Calcarisporiella thermophila]|uniref:uncharacterized protein n=1 Tax=Calcarisporiella thermophila TaxID=911321 RepID=UPI003742F749